MIWLNFFLGYDVLSLVESKSLALPVLEGVNFLQAKGPDGRGDLNC
jgi:hypothetical protein